MSQNLRMAAARHVELFLARVFDLHRPARGQGQRAADVFQQHFLLAAEAAADAGLDHVHALTGICRIIATWRRSG